jgi:hypothetical protein
MDDMSLLHWLLLVSEHPPRDRWNHCRVEWDMHVEQLLHEGRFEREYRMSLSAHEQLVELLTPSLQRVEFNSRGSTGPILVEHIVALGLRSLAGGRIMDIRHIIGASSSASYKALDDFVNAVNATPELDIKFPSSPEEWKEVNDGFKAKSSDGIMQGCVGAIDGYFQRTQTPKRQEVGNVTSYYSGHYESHGVNCQACVRSDLSFMYFGIISPGSTNDNISYPMAVGLRETVESLPTGMYCVADAAYTLQENLLVPYTGRDQRDPAHDAFNFYMSQLRIRVEMAFGLLTNKFRILKGRMVGSLDRISAIVMACARLHNFIISVDGNEDERGCDEVREESTIVKDAVAPFGMAYLPVVPNEEWVPFDGLSYTREGIVEYLRENSIQRPLYNLERKRNEVFQSSNNTEWDREYVSPS